MYVSLSVQRPTIRSVPPITSSGSSPVAPSGARTTCAAQEQRVRVQELRPERSTPLGSRERVEGLVLAAWHHVRGR